MKDEWEEINKEEGESTARMRVPGGWIVRAQEWDSVGDGETYVVALTFVPDPGHAWGREHGDNNR
ncbi:MAG: hypothetical protein ABIE42_05815 [Candidatus Eisenbacteria bacterium]